MPRNFTQFNYVTPTSGDYLVGYNSSGVSEIRTSIQDIFNFVQSYSPIQSEFTTLCSLSANWNSVYSYVNANSANFYSTYSTLYSLSSNFYSTYSTLCSLSANWNSVYSYVNANSANPSSTTYNTLCSLSTRPVFYNQLYYSTDNQVSQLSSLSGNYDEGQFFGKIKLSQNNTRLINFGKTWTSKGTIQYWNSIAMSSDGKYQTAVVDGEKIYISNDYGNNWTAKDSNRFWRGIAMSSDGKYQTTAESNGQIYISSDYGNSWTPKDSNRAWYKFAMSSDGKYQTAVVDDGQIYISSDYGNNWIAKESNRYWRGVAMSSDGKYQTTAESNGQIYISSDYGNNWIAKDSNRVWREVAMSSDGKYQTAAVGGNQIYSSIDYGNTWFPQGPVKNWWTVAMSSDGKYRIALSIGTFEQIYISVDYGYTWNVVGPTSDLTNWSSVAMSSDGKYSTAILNGQKIYVSKADELIDGSLVVSNTVSAFSFATSAGNSFNWNSTYSFVNSTSAYQQNYVGTVSLSTNNFLELLASRSYVQYFSATNIPFTNPHGVALAYNKIYISQHVGGLTNGRIVVINDPLGDLNNQTLITLPNEVDIPDIVYHKQSDRIYGVVATNNATDKVIRLNPVTNTYDTFVLLDSGNTSTNSCITCDDEYLYVGAFRRVYRIRISDGTILNDYFGSGQIAGTVHTIKITPDKKYIMCATVIEGTGIYRINIDTGAVNVFDPGYTITDDSVLLGDYVYFCTEDNSGRGYKVNWKTFAVEELFRFKPSWGCGTDNNFVYFIHNSTGGFAPEGVAYIQKYDPYNNSWHSIYAATTIPLLTASRINEIFFLDDYAFLTTYGYNKIFKAKIKTEITSIPVLEDNRTDWNINNSANYRLTVNSGNSDQWSSTYTYINSNSANFVSTYSTLCSLSANFYSTYSTLCSLSANFYSTYSTLCSLSANFYSTYSTLCSLSANWNSVYTNVQANSALWEESADIIPTVITYLSTNNVTLCSAQIKNTISLSDELIFSSPDEGIYLGENKISQNNIQLLPNTISTIVSAENSRVWQDVATSANGRYITATTFQGLFYVSQDYGKTWNEKLSPTTRDYRSAAMSSDGRYQMVCSFFNPVFASNDYGTTWSQVSGNGIINNTDQWVKVAMSSEGKYRIIIAFPQRVYTSENYGATWTLALTENNGWNDAAISSDGRHQTVVGGFIPSGGGGKQIQVSNDYGKTWTSKGTSQLYTKVAVSSNGKYQLASTGFFDAFNAYTGNLYTSKDYGNNWTQITNTREWSDVAMTSDGRYQYALAWQDRRIYGSDNYGTNWNILYQFDTPQFNPTSIAISSDSKYKILVGSNNPIYISVADELINGNLSITNKISAFGGDFTGNLNVTNNLSALHVKFTGRVEEGTDTKALNSDSHAEGSYSQALGASSHAEGLGTTASGQASHAEGTATIALGFTSHAEGYNTLASKPQSHAEGNSTRAQGAASHAEGNLTLASGANSHAEGSDTMASGTSSHAEGNLTLASGEYSHAEGRFTITGRKNNFAYTSTTQTFTFSSLVSSNFSYVTSGIQLRGYDELVLNDYFTITVASRNSITGAISATQDVIGGDVPFGGENSYLVDNSGFISHAEGESTSASGFVSHAEGSNTIASATFSHAEGLSTQASGSSSHSEGSNTVASGSASHAEGYETTAGGNQSHAEGFRSVASNDHSHAEGYQTLASGNASHAEGDSTVASGSASHAEGNYTRAIGTRSHAAGFKTTAAQDFTYIWSDGNLGTLNQNISTTRTGQYMVSSSGGVFIPGKVGIGIDCYSQGLSSNALTVNGIVSATSFYGDGSNLTNINFTLSADDVTLKSVTLNPIATLSATNLIVSRSLQEKLGEIISVKDFGAKGDGATNDWLSIQRALSAASGIARVYIPQGLYYINQELKIPSNSYIYGAGIGTTVIKLSSSADASQCVMTNSQNTRSVLTNQGNENIIIKDLELDGNVSRFGGSYSVIGDSSGCGLSLSFVKNALVERVSVHDACRHCIDIGAPETTLNSDPNEYTPNPSFNVHLKDIIAYGGSDDNITTHFSRNIIIENAYVPYTGGRLVPSNSNGIEIDDGSYDVTIIGGYIKNCIRGLEIKGHSYAPAAKRIKVYGLTVENCVRNYGFRHLGFDSVDSKTAYDISLYDCTSISPVSSTETPDSPRALQISNYDGVYLRNFQVVGEHNTSTAISIQERARNVVFDGLSFTAISGTNPGISQALLTIDNTAARNIKLKNVRIRDCVGLPIYATGSIPGIEIDGVYAINSLSGYSPSHVVDFSWSPLDTPYSIRNVSVVNYLSAYKLGGTHNFTYSTPDYVGIIENIVPSSPATAGTQYTVARFGWREGDAQGLNAGIGSRIEFTTSLTSGTSANQDIPVAYIGTEKSNATDTDASASLVFGTRPNNANSPVKRFTIEPTGRATVSQTLAVSGNLEANGSTLLTNNLGVSGNVTFTNNLSAFGSLIVFRNLPTASTGLPTGALWNDNGTLKIA